MKRFNMINEDFTCEHCGMEIKKADKTARDHCNYCLYSKHVDINPGDRACDCHGLMPAVGLDTKNGEFVLVQRCQKCGFVRRNKIWENDSQKAIRAIMNNTLPEYIEGLKKINNS